MKEVLHNLEPFDITSLPYLRMIFFFVESFICERRSNICYVTFGKNSSNGLHAGLYKSIRYGSLIRCKSQKQSAFSFNKRSPKHMCQIQKLWSESNLGHN